MSALDFQALAPTPQYCITCACATKDRSVMSHEGTKQPTLMLLQEVCLPPTNNKLVELMALCAGGMCVC